MENEELVVMLRKQRGFLIQTTRGVSDADARRRTTVSALTLGGIIKHVSSVEDTWRRFITEGPAAFSAMGGDYEAGFRMEVDETLDGLLARYAAVAEETDRLLLSLASLEDTQRLPEAPWFEPGASWSARRVAMHILAETAQHSGHADIIRESLDGAKTMG